MPRGIPYRLPAVWSRIGSYMSAEFMRSLDFSAPFLPETVRDCPDDCELPVRILDHAHSACDRRAFLMGGGVAGRFSFHSNPVSPNTVRRHAGSAPGLSVFCPLSRPCMNMRPPLKMQFMGTA